MGTIGLTSREFWGENKGSDYACLCSLCDLSSIVTSGYTRTARRRGRFIIMVNTICRYTQSSLGGDTLATSAETRRASLLICNFSITGKSTIEETLAFFVGKVGTRE